MVNKDAFVAFAVCVLLALINVPFMLQGKLVNTFAVGFCTACALCVALISYAYRRK